MTDDGEAVFLLPKQNVTVMQRPSFQHINTFMAWAVFCLAAILYCTTAEPTASLWDCPEFIISACKLEIGHAPGAPFFMLTANLFSQLTSDPGQVARMVNIMSAILSAGCVMLLFLSISHLVRRLLCGRKPLQATRDIVITEGSALVGALVYAVSDSFWYSAVEAEVYAYSSFLTALVFRLMLCWEEDADNPKSTRWILLISYLTGLSIGVHLLNLLCIPSMVLIYYFRKTEKISRRGICKSLLVSFLILGGILYGLIPGILWMSGRMELLLVNVFSLPFNSGLITFVLLLSVLVAVGMRYLHGRRRTVLACTSLILVGFSCYATILIRSAANPPMDENSPEDVFALQRYLNREQYGESPLFYGPTYKSEVEYERQGNMMVAKCKEGATIWQKSQKQGRYVAVGRKQEYVYDRYMLFPRMHSRQHARGYEQWMGGVDGPTMAENLHFFVSYQLYFMYVRYFLWNFVGRQSDVQGNGETENGNWITGIDAIDGLLLGCDMDKLPSDLRHNPGRNVYYALPLILGLAGILWQRSRGRQGRMQFRIVFWLFFMTGIAIVLYLNQTVPQARERDYSYAGSFYAFSIWVGMGVAAMARILQHLHRNKTVSAIFAVVLCLAIPLQMLSENLDDHNRSRRYTARDFGQNYLQSSVSEGNPIILTYGDNETFPLWYNQEVEGVRTDVRVCNLSYADTDWYIDQMLRPAYDSPALPLGWRREDYAFGNNDYVLIRPDLHDRVLSLYDREPETMRRIMGDEPFEMGNILKHWVFCHTDGMDENDIRLRKYAKALICREEYIEGQPEIRCIPTDKAFVTQPAGWRMPLSMSGMRMLTKGSLMVMQLLSCTDNPRPLYVTTSMSLDLLPFLKPYLVLEGMLYRIVPSYDENGGKMQIDVEHMYDNFMHGFAYGGLSHNGVYADYDVRKLAWGHTHQMAILTDTLLRAGDTARALDITRKWQETFPAGNIPHDDSALPMAECLYRTGNTAEADSIAEGLLTRSEEWLTWIYTLSPQRRRGSEYTEYVWLRTLERAMNTLALCKREEILQKHYPKYEQIMQNKR